MYQWTRFLWQNAAGASLLIHLFSMKLTRGMTPLCRRNILLAIFFVAWIALYSLRPLHLSDIYNRYNEDQFNGILLRKTFPRLDLEDEQRK